MSSDALIQAHRREVGRDLYKAKNDLYFLAVKLGYKWNPGLQRGMTEKFHGPLCARMDRLRDHERVGNFWARWHLKTTVITICLAIQEILRDPNITIHISHAIDEKAEEMVSEIGDQFISNEWLRKLCYAIDSRGFAPPKSKASKWLKKEKFTVLSRTRFSRQATVTGKGVNSDITSAHVDLFILDDVISRKTLENSELPKVLSWYRNTVLTVLNAGGRIRAVGTRWDESDLWGGFIASDEWDTVVRGSLERVELEADEATGKVLEFRIPDRSSKGDPVLYGPGTGRVKGGIDAARRRLKKLMRPDEMGPDFDPQMQNDPSPAGEKPWTPGCERFMPVTDIPRGVTIVFSDPAPMAVGSFSQEKEKERKDGTKDDWAHAAVRMYTVGQRLRAVLLEGSYSRSWDKDEGWETMARLAQRWNATYLMPEATGQAIALYTADLAKAARLIGSMASIEKLEGTYRGNAKNIYFGALASMAKYGDFFISDGCSPEFVEKFLQQARGWRPLGGGKNGLKKDDCANVVSFLTDPAVMKLAPEPESELDPAEEYIEEWGLEEELANSRVRHLAV